MPLIEASVTGIATIARCLPAWRPTGVFAPGRAVAGALRVMSSRPGSLFRRPGVVIVTW
jgi:hypothetical protein